ncbi:MAG: DUF6796 family protein [Ruminiclostridium sp.]
MSQFNDIGIESKLDWMRIRKLLIIGFIAGCMVFAGDMILGYGVYDHDLTGLERTLASKAAKTDVQLFWAAFLGFVGIPLEGLSYFGIYRLIAERSPKHAHAYRSGIFGILMFGGCGVHVPCVAAVYFYKQMMLMGDTEALAKTIKFAGYFLLPGTVLFFIFFVLLIAVQISAFVKGMTPYPKWCWIFSLGVGVIVLLLTKIVGNNALANGLSTAWISIGDIWMTGGLLLMMKKSKNTIERK